MLWPLSVFRSGAYVEAAETAVCLVMKAALLSGQWAGQHRSTALCASTGPVRQARRHPWQ